MSTHTLERHVQSGKAIAYPMHHVLGIIPNPNLMPSVTADLVDAGFAEDSICVLGGEEGCGCLDAEGARHGPLFGLLRAWQHFTPEYEHLARYERALREGQCVVAVRARTHLDWEPIVAVMTRYGGSFVHYYGWMIHDLVP